MDYAAPRSGLAKAGGILLLAGGIVRIVAGAFFALFGLVFAALFNATASRATTSSRAPPNWFYGLFTGVYIGMGLLVAAGGIVGLVGWQRAQRGNYSGAFVWGLVGSLLPPVDILLLLGAIFCKVSPEGESRAPAPGWPTPAPQTR